MNPVAQLLLDARCIITDPKNWQQDETGDLRHGPNCATGALAAAALLTDRLEWVYIAVEYLTTAAEMNLTAYNDHRTHAEILDMFDAAFDAAAEYE